MTLSICPKCLIEGRKDAGALHLSGSVPGVLCKHHGHMIPTELTELLAMAARRNTLRARVGRAVFRMGYNLEESRQLAAAHQRYMREAGACVALALLRIVGAA